METFVLLTVTGLGLGAMYFLIASGLSLIYGLMGVLNFAHGAFLTIGAYVSWRVTEQLDGQIASLGLRVPDRRARRARRRRDRRDARRGRAHPPAVPAAASSRCS